MHTLQALKVSKRFGERTVVNSVSVDLQSGEVVGLLGPNGAGKTTTFYMFTGLIAPDQGHILLDGKEITKDPMYIRSKLGVGYLPQEASVFRKLSAEDNVMAILETIEDLSAQQRAARCEMLLQELGLLAIRKSVGSSLSGGERRRVEIARSLARSPHFILLDEPFAGIDPIAIRDIQNIVASLRDKGIGVLITDHNVRETLGICDRAYIMVDGKVLEEGSPLEIASSALAQKHYLGQGFAL